MNIFCVPIYIIEKIHIYIYICICKLCFQVDFGQKELSKIVTLVSGSCLISHS